MGWFNPSGSGASGGAIVVGTTTVTGGTSGYVLYDNGGLVGEYAISGTGSVVLTGSPALTGTPTFAGSTSGTTGLKASAVASGTLTLPAATDTLVGKATTDTLTNKTISGADNTLSNIGNSSLTNSSITVNGTSISLGSSGTITASASAITVGTTTVSGGTTTRVLYDNAGTLGEYTISGSGTVVAMATSPSFTTPALGAATGTSLSVTGNVYAYNATAIPAGGTTGSGYTFSSTANFGMFFGSGAPTLSAAQGSLYLSSNGVPYYNTNGSTGWSAVGSTVSSNVTVGSSTITGGTSGRVLYDNAGVLGEYTVTGTAGSVVLSDSPQFTTGIGVGIAATTARLAAFGGNVTGSTVGMSVSVTSSIQSDVTSNYRSFYSNPSTQATAFTLNTLRHFEVPGTGLGSGSVINTQYGFLVGASMTQATTNYGFYGNLASATGVYNLYMNGTAANYLQGATTLASALTYGGVTLSNSVTGTGSMVLSASPTLTGTVTLGSASYTTSSNTAPLAMARAWVNFNGSSGAINDSMNVSSVTRNAAGNYTVNLTTAAPNTTYAKVATGYGGPGLFTGTDWVAATTGAFGVYTANTVTQAYQDGNPVNAVAYW